MGKVIAILGSTGSIGRRALDVVRSLGADWRIEGLAAGGNWQELARQAIEFRPRLVALAQDRHYAELKSALAAYPIQVRAGMEGVLEVASAPQADFVLCAIVGSVSIPPVFAAAAAGKTVALASKEALVVSGRLLLDEARRSGATIIPVDSEHSAVFQALQAGRTAEVRSITLTASGGPFLDWPLEKMQKANLAEALDHPKWSMGKKITIDSATMMNKALEIIEAHYLFDLPAEQIRVTIHPEAIIHSLVEFCDGVMIAQMSNPDMAIPIQYTLTWPQRRPSIAKMLNLAQVGKLTFREPDRRRFPALDLAYEAARKEGTAPAVINAANEQAVQYFIQGKIAFCDIVRHSAEVLSRHTFAANPTLPELLEVDRWAREEVTRCLN